MDDLAEGEPQATDGGFSVKRRLALLEQLPDALVVIDGEGRVVYINGRLTELTDFTLDDVRGEVIFEFVHPDDVGYMLWAFEARQANEGQNGLVVQGRVATKDGRWLVVEISGRSLLSTEVGGLVVAARDMTHQAALADSPARLRSMVDRTTDVVILVGADGNVIYANRRLTTLGGHDCDRAVGKPWHHLLAPAHHAEASRRLAAIIEGGGGATDRWRSQLLTSYGEVIDAELHAVNQLDDPVIDGVIVSARDVRELLAMEQEIRAQRDRLAYEATHDALTGLPNRAAFLAMLDAELTKAAANDEEVVVAFCDLDGFKPVNDELGHHAGDAVLAEVGNRLRAAVRTQDVVARHGGDEFVVLLAGAPTEDDVAGLVQRLSDQIAAPIVVGDVTTGVGASVGIARMAARDTDVDAVLRAADAAMYNAKRSRRATDPATR